MVDLLFLPDDDFLTKKGKVITLYDPACGTGGMLSVSEEYLRDHNSYRALWPSGSYNAQAYAVCAADMMIKGQSLENIALATASLKIIAQTRNSTTCSPIHLST